MVQQLFNDVEQLRAEIRRLRGQIDRIAIGGTLVPGVVPGVPQLPLPIEGAILYGSSVPEWIRRAPGNDGDILTMVDGLPDWEPGPEVFIINMAAAL